MKISIIVWNVLTLNLPPLRDCPQDIMPLTELFVARFADEQGVPRPKLTADLNTVLTRYACQWEMCGS